jgi:hypothetical protein
MHGVLLMALGILMIVLGMLGFYQPFVYTVATTIFFGAAAGDRGHGNPDGVQAGGLEGQERRERVAIRWPWTIDLCSVPRMANTAQVDPRLAESRPRVTRGDLVIALGG